MTEAQSDPARAAPWRRVPAPLAALLVVVFLFGLAWALLVPPGQVPDEFSHIQYTQTIAENHELPGHGRNGVSTEASVSLRSALRGDIAFNGVKRPSWTRGAYVRWKRHAADLPRDDGGDYVFQDDNPPLYYAYESLAYWAGGSGDFFVRLHLMRIWSGMLLLVATTGAWLLAGEVFARDRLLQLAASALVGLQPMARFISAGVNPDAGLWAVWSIALWLGVRILRRGLTVRDGVALGLVAGFGVWVKATGWGLVPAAAFAIALAWLRLRPADRGRRPRRSLALPLGALAASSVAWVVTATALGRAVVNYAPGEPGRVRPSISSLHSLREFASYVWQFYLPRLPFQTPFWHLGDGGYRLYEGWMKTGWAAFGWLEVRFGEWTYTVLALVSALLIVGGVAALARADLRRRVDSGVVAFLLLASVGLFALLHWADYTFIVLQDHAIEQGRYVLPIVSIGGLAVAGTVSLLRPRRRPLAVGLVLAALFTFQLASLGVTMERYFA